MLTSALDHYRRQQRIVASGITEARRAKKRNFTEVARVVTAFQLVAARDAVDSADLMLAEQGIDDPPSGQVAITNIAGTASDGRPLETLFPQARNDFSFDLMVATQIKDAARVAAGVGIASRYNAGYVRMLNPPSCSRCTILAGRFYQYNQGFQRHPGCDCVHVPALESTATDLTTNPDTYFHSLSEAEQNRIFTKAGAQAVRDGADLGQVVNARRGMATAQIARRDLLISREGVTKRGRAWRGRTGRNMQARLMPESIYAVAEDRAEVQRLLRLHGFLI